MFCGVINSFLDHYVYDFFWSSNKKFFKLEMTDLFALHTEKCLVLGLIGLT